MTVQHQFRLPATGDVWRHYKAGSEKPGDGLYTVVGIARDSEGDAVVVYTDYHWQLPQLAPLYTQTVGRFLQEVENNTPRFAFVGDCAEMINNRCQYIDWAEVNRRPFYEAGVAAMKRSATP